MTVAKEQFVNRWATTLAAGLTIDGTTLTLTAVAGLPTTGQMRFLLGTNDSGEKILAQLNGTTTLTGCTRGAEGSTASTHTSGEAVTAILTAGALNNLTDWLQAGMVMRLATVAGIDLNNGTAQALYTVPTAFPGGAAVTGCVPTQVIYRAPSIELDMASWSVGWTDAAYADVIADEAHIEMVATTVYSIDAPMGGARGGGTAEVLKLKVNTLQGTAATMTVDLFGYLF
jgi:hypothetical protein